jgi:hypothetical protein
MGDGDARHARFEPDVDDALCEALARVLATLGVRDLPCELGDRAAAIIVKLANAGERDPERLEAETLKSLRQ